MWRLALALALLASCGSANDQTEPKVIPWQAAGNHIGERCVVEGRIVQTVDGGEVCFLKLHPEWEGRFKAVIFSHDYDSFPVGPWIYYRNKKVRITGTITDFEGTPEIVLRDSTQIRVLPETNDHCDGR